MGHKFHEVSHLVSKTKVGSSWKRASEVDFWPPLGLPCASAVPLSPSPPISFVVSICFFSQFTHFGSYTSRNNILTSRKQKLSLFGVSCTFIGNFEKYRSSVCFSLNMSFHLPVTLLSKKTHFILTRKYYESINRRFTWNNKTQNCVRVLN